MNCWIPENDIGKLCSYLISDDALEFLVKLSVLMEMLLD